MKRLVIFFPELMIFLKSTEDFFLTDRVFFDRDFWSLKLKEFFRLLLLVGLDGEALSPLGSP